MAQSFKEWMRKNTGYECITTFWDDFSIADSFGGVPAIKDTYKRAFSEWKTNCKYLTELALILNHKAWFHYDAWRNGEARSLEIGKLYCELYEKANNYARMHLKGDELAYYHITTD